MEVAMEISRPSYLDQLITYAGNGQVKVITGIRRCGKSYLLNQLYRKYLLSQGVKEKQIISIALDLAHNIRYRNPLELVDYIRSIVENKKGPYYLFIDEIQMSDTIPNPYNASGKQITFYDALNDLKTIPDLDIYVTGSNSKMLSSDILTEFRGRSDEIRVHPLSFAEYYAATGGDKSDAFDAYAFYGGMPFILSRSDDESRMAYLKSLFSEVYIKDIVERKNIVHEDVLDDIVDFLCSSVGSLTNPNNVANSINSMQKRKNADHVAQNTIKAYMGHLIDAFLFSECKRYDVKGRSYFSYPNKYYCEDVGLRNARTGFRQQELTHIMENIVYNELMIRRCSVDVGVIGSTEKDDAGKQKRITREIDFIVTKSGEKYYIQSAFAMETEAKQASESKPLSMTGDSFPKIIVRHDIRKRWYDENGILNIGILDFLLDGQLL